MTCFSNFERYGNKCSSCKVRNSCSKKANSMKDNILELLRKKRDSDRKYYSKPEVKARRKEYYKAYIRKDKVTV